MTTANPILVIPGFHGSGPGHWQTWLQSQLPAVARINGIDWEQPVLALWAERVRTALAAAPVPLTVIAHSFGCLAAVVAAADLPEQVADLILVAPADPDRFDFAGLKPPHTQHDTRFNLSRALPLHALQVPGLLIASRNDPWLSLDKARQLAEAWELQFHDIGDAGHINTESGYGAWPWLSDQLQQRQLEQSQLQQRAQHNHAASTGAGTARLKRGRGSNLAAVRQVTRAQMASPYSHRQR